MKDQARVMEHVAKAVGLGGGREPGNAALRGPKSTQPSPLCRNHDELGTFRTAKVHAQSAFGRLPSRPLPKVHAQSASDICQSASRVHAGAYVRAYGRVYTGAWARGRVLFSGGFASRQCAHLNTAQITKS
jgi:hypothetical protein